MKTTKTITDDNWVVINDKLICTLADWNWRVSARKSAKARKIPIPFKMELVQKEKHKKNLIARFNLDWRYNIYIANQSYSGGVSYTPSPHFVNYSLKIEVFNQWIVETRQPIKYGRDSDYPFYVIYKLNRFEKYTQ